METESKNGNAERFFKEENVWVRVKTQRELGELRIVQLGLPSKLPEDTQDFKLERLVINFEVRSDIGFVKTFDPAMELRVGLLEDEVRELRLGHRELKLAYYALDTGKWVVLHDFEIDLEARDAVAWISDWPDATVGAGR
jgi:hypothetical protein